MSAPALAAPTGSEDADAYDYGEYGAADGEELVEEGGDGNLDDEIAALEGELNEAEETQAKIEETAGEAKQAASAAIAAKKEEEAAKKARDDRSVFVGNVDWNSTAEELTHFFETCGAVERTTILMDKFNQPKG
jgi:polyadenylate-binding protein 2